MTRLLSIILLFSLLFVGCNRTLIVTEGGEDGVSIAFSSAFTMSETKAGTKAEVIVSGDNLPIIRARVVGSETANVFTTLYTSADLAQNSSNIIIKGATLNQDVVFTGGKGTLPKMVKYSAVSTDANSPVYVRAFAPTSSDSASFKMEYAQAEDTVKITGLSGQEDVLMSTFNVAYTGTDQPTVDGVGTATHPKMSLKFMHKLAKVSFQFKASSVDAKASWGAISKVELLDYPNNISLRLAKDTANLADDALSTPTLADLDYYVDYTVFDDIVAFNPATPVPLTFSVTVGGGSTAVPAKDSELFTYAMVPPTALDLRTAGTSWRIRIHYVITAVQYSLDLEPTVDKQYVLEPGKHHNYVVTLYDDGSKKSATLAVTIAPWKEGTVGGGIDIH